MILRELHRWGMIAWNRAYGFDRATSVRNVTWAVDDGMLRHHVVMISIGLLNLDRKMIVQNVVEGIAFEQK